MTSVLFPQWAQLELERILAKAKAHPDQVGHWFQMLPQGSRDMLAESMFQALVAEGGRDDGPAAA